MSNSINTGVIRKTIGSVFLILALVFSVLLVQQTHFSIQLQSWLSLSYFAQLSPLILSGIFLITGVFLLLKHKKTNAILTLFGHGASEEIAFSWLGLTTTQFPSYAILPFFCCSIIALWLAYSNRLKLKPVSVGDAVVGIITGIILSLLSGYV